MGNPVLKYGSTDIEYMPKLCQLLTSCGHPTTEMTQFNWHHYTRVLQFQVKMVMEYPYWGIGDVDGIVGPKTWGALEALGKPQGGTNTSSTPSTMPSVEMQLNSPNKSARGATITHIVMHATAGSFSGSVEWLCNPQARASAHLVISQKGITAQLVKFSEKAWHAGSARYNANSIGIELEAYNSSPKLTKIQSDLAKNWVRWLMKEYDIPKENVIIHRWVRNTDCPMCWTDDEFKAWRDSL